MALLKFPRRDETTLPTNGNQLFPSGVRQSERARVEAENRHAEAERLRAILLDDDHTHEIFMPAPWYSANTNELMPTPDEAASKFGRGNYRIYDEMARNVLAYGSLVQGQLDMLSHLNIEWLPGMKGDRDSEEATEAIASAYENIDERAMAIEWWGHGFERGFSPVENVWGMHSRGAARDWISVVEWITRPINEYGFNYRKEPLFKSDMDPARRTSAIPEYKVSFLRYGSNHSPYGRGFGQVAYPTVWAIDSALKGFMARNERFGHLPLIATYPNTWKARGIELVRLKAVLESQTKNVIYVPGEVDKVDYSTLGAEAAYANANATAVSVMQYVAKLETWLSLFIQGSQYTAGQQAEGSNAREQVADTARWYKAPSRASCIEATLNRGFVRPTMLVNRPDLEESKWPRCSIDASFGEDLKFLLDAYERLAKMKFPISHVTVSEKFSIPIATPGDAVLDLTTPAPLPIGGEIEGPDPNPFTAAAQMMSEKSIVTVARADGSTVSYPSDFPVYTLNRGIVRAGQLQRDDILEAPKDHVRAAS